MEFGISHYGQSSRKYILHITIDETLCKIDAPAWRKYCLC